MTFLLIAIFALSLTACVTKKFENKGNISDNAESGEQGAFINVGDSIYGKITSIIGNEIEIAIAKKIEDEDAELDDMKGEAIIPNENDMPVIGGSGSDDAADNLEFTGETKSFTISAGIKIYNMGQEINLSSLKKGDIISVSVDSDDTVLAVDKVK